MLSRMAVDILSIPAMSAEVERVFSATKKTISEGRWNLNPTAINGIKCLRSWFRAGYYTMEELHEIIGAETTRSGDESIELEQDDIISMIDGWQSE